MKAILRTLYIVPLCLLLTGCWTRIWTVAPTTEYVAPVKTVYTTSVTTPAPKHTTVQTVTVTSFNNDLSFYLDLQAVAAAFAESRSVREFEQILNSSRYMINNLDLNGDGWIDYLRVIETYRGNYHTFLIQACLDYGVFQDVATLIAERRPNTLYVEVVGDRYLYGPNYIVRPTFIKRPPLWDDFGRSSYALWSSPYAYGAFPSYYMRPKPVYLSHYQAYVTTYISNHHYCHVCDYPTTVFYTNYTVLVQPNRRNDFADQHPQQSFEQRVTHTLTANGSGVTVRNAGELRTHTQNRTSGTAETRTSSTSTRSSSATTSGATTRSTGATQGQTTNRTAATASTRTEATPKTTTSKATSGVTTRSTGATQGQTTNRTSATASTRTEATSKTTTAKATSGTSTRSGSTTRQPSTTVETRVNKSGTTRTTIRQTDASGRTTTVKRTSSSTSTRSGATSTRTSGTSTRTSTSTGTSGTSTRTSGTTTSTSRTSGSTRR